MGDSQGPGKTARRKGLPPKGNLGHLMILPDSKCCSRRASITAMAIGSCNSYNQLLTPCQELNGVERMNIPAKCLKSMFPFSPPRSKKTKQTKNPNISAALSQMRKLRVGEVRH